MKIKVAMVSLGCPKNQVDAEIILAILAKSCKVVDVAQADVVVINTCGFIESAKQEAIDAILEMAALKSEGVIRGIVVTGCLSERYREELSALLPEIDGILGAGSIFEVENAVKAAYGNQKFASFLPLENAKQGGERLLSTPFYMAYLKISDGCDNRCAYCAIPNIRGSLRSRPMEELVAEAESLAKGGVRELIVIAQDTTVYGRDLYGEIRICALLRALAKIEGLTWIRMLYCYPDKITDDLVALFKSEPKLLPYIDLPLQHASDNILQRMNRHGKLSDIQESLKKLHEIPNICIRTTFICGFPTETDEDFGSLCDFVKEEQFDRMGAFSYSAEEDTVAAEMEGQIDEDLKKRRVEILMTVQNEISLAKNQTFIGQTLLILVEGYDEESIHFMGRSYRDAPDIDGKVYFYLPVDFEGQEPNVGDFVKVLIENAEDYDLFGKMN